jgi:glycosyltransferase involved in cell wall biosynthesis
MFKRVKKLHEIILGLDPDIIFSSSVISNMVCLITKKYYKIDKPLVITFNNSIEKKSEDMGIKGPISTFFNVRLSRYADRVVTVSKVLEEEVLGMGFSKDKTVTIYNGLDFNEMNEKAVETIEEKSEGFFSDKCPVVVSVGRLSAQKNYTMLIDSFSRLRKEMNVRLVIVGDGEDFEMLSTMCRKYGIANDVLFTGWVKNPYKYLKRSDIFVLSSLWEGFPNVLLEAMALGLPVISTDCPTGPNEIITSDDVGVLIPVNDTDALFNRMKDILTDKKLRKKLSINGKKRAMEFSIEKKAKEYENLFEEML